MAFANASNFTMDNVQVNAIVNQTNIHQSLADSDPWRMLLNYSAINAMADSPDVYEPTCHPGTREVVTEHIMVWARDPNAAPILWLSGPAGAGKSCIQRTIVQSCTAEGLFVACFFFSIKHPETNNQTRFITTLAAQLAENIVGLKWYIGRAFKMDRRMFTRALESQLEGLIFKPLQELDSSMSNRLKRLFWTIVTTLGVHWEDPNKPCTRPNVIVIDGLDECVDQREQAHILRLIHVLATHSHFPFRFAIASRPEYAIRTAFSSSPLSNDTLILRLEEYKADEDLRQFIKAGFSRLKADHPLSTSMPADWPSTGDENALVAKASGQFVYVSVVMKHLANPHRNPMLELQHILDHGPAANDIKSNPFAELDALYNRILHPLDVDISCLKSILHSITHDKSERSPSPVDDLDILLGLKPGTTTTTLVDLHSLLNFDSPGRPTLHHKSLEDYLASPSRAGDLYQSDDQTHVQLTLAYYELGRQLQHQDRGSFTNVWGLGPAITFHACSVSDWRLFERDFAKNTLPAFIDSIARVDTTRVPSSNPSWLELYLLRYHSILCTSEDDCLPRCKQSNRLPQLKLNLICTYLLSDGRVEGKHINLAPPGMLKVDTLSKAACGCAGDSKETTLDIQTNGKILNNSFRNILQKVSIGNEGFQREINRAIVKCKLAPSFESLNKLKFPSFKTMDDAAIIMLWGSLKSLADARRSYRGRMPPLETVEQIFQQNPFLELDCSKNVDLKSDDLSGEREFWMFSNYHERAGVLRRSIGKSVREWFESVVADKDFRDTMDILLDEIQDELNQLRSDPAFEFRDLSEGWRKTFIGGLILRFPDLTNPYIQVYHIRIHVRHRQQTGFILERTYTFVEAEYHLRQYKPREYVIEDLGEELRKMINGGEELIDDSAGPPSL